METRACKLYRNGAKKIERVRTRKREKDYLDRMHLLVSNSFELKLYVVITCKYCVFL